MANIHIHSRQQRFPIAPTLYGLFFEDLNRAGDGGLYPELLRNRAFDDGIPPVDMTLEEDGWMVSRSGRAEFAFHNGEGLQRWIRDNNDGAQTPVAAWYTGNADMQLDTAHTLHSNRTVALAVDFAPGGKLWNIGYAGVPARAGEAYHLYFFANVPAPLPLRVSIETADAVLCSAELTLSGSGYTRYDLTLVPNATSGRAKLVFTAPAGGKVTFGFASLMPTTTFHGHGLRVDLAQKLADLKPGFLRFPGGGLVGGHSESTAMRFKETVGPVWERKGRFNLWGYHMTDGLGYHEYLQLCEDLNTEPLYVCNCGMTCEGLMSDEGLEEMVQDALAALEYALGDADSEWGALRAKMGHPAPFRLQYLELGNEHYTPDYNDRYKYFRERIVEHYPQLKIIANTHVENYGLPVDISDEHFYNQTEYFARCANYYDEYDRNGPEIFVGEFAVIGGPIRTMYPAVGEAMFLLGMERNQDIVTMACYAPLFENVNYCKWEPNLIVFDNLRSYGLPSYYAWKLLAEHRGQTVLASEQESAPIYVDYVKGCPALQSAPDTVYRSARWKGHPVAPSRALLGSVEDCAESFVVHGIDPDKLSPMMRHFGMGEKTLIVLGDDPEAKDGVFEIEVLAQEGKAIAVGMCSTPLPQADAMARNAESRSGETKPYEPWTTGSVRPISWRIHNGVSSLSENLGLSPAPLAADVPVSVTPGVFHKLRMENSGTHISCYLDDVLVHHEPLPYVNTVESVALDDGDEIILKLTNISNHEEPVEITLDCAVASAYEVGVVGGSAAVRNTLDEPLQVRDVWRSCEGAAQQFVYHAPACSVNVLRLRKA